MAFVKALVRDDKDIRGVQPTQTEARYKVQDVDGRRLFQLNTYGSSERLMRDQASQTLQFDEARAKQLWEVLGKAFGFSNAKS